MLKESLHRSYMAEFIRSIHDSIIFPKLRTYKLFKNEFIFENYLSSTKHLNHTLALFHFRISFHNLRIETGHYTKPKTPINDRICIYCTSQTVESESHFLLECSLYIMERRELVERITNYLPDFNYISNEQKFVTIMSAEEKCVTDALDKFIYTCLKTRIDATSLEASR